MVEPGLRMMPMKARFARSDTLSTGFAHILHEADAARAQDAAIGDVQDVRTEVLDGLNRCKLPVARARPACLEDEILELALAGLIANRAIQRVIDEQNSSTLLACVLRRRA